MTDPFRCWPHLAAPTLSLCVILGVISTPITAHAGFDDLIFSEIMYHPADAGSVDGDAYEFLEIKNTGTDPVDLSGLFFDSGLTFAFPTGTVIPGGGFVVLAADAARFQERYGFAPTGVFTGTLSNAGEELVLLAAQGTLLLEVEYDDEAPWPIAADGSGFSIVPRVADGRLNLVDPANWRLSARVGGSPGADDPPPPPEPVIVINELLAHTDPPQQDAVELHNTGNQTVNIGGWYLTDNVSVPMRHRILTGTTIPPGGYLILDEEDFNPPGSPSGFSFSESGEDVLLFAADASGELTGTVHGYRFGASENQVSFGRHVNSQGDEHFVRQSALTFGQQNAGPRPSPIAISEIMYRTADDSPEFIELVNITNGVIPLFDPLIPQNTWRIDGIAYNLPPGIILGPGEVLLAVGSNPTTFRARRGLPESVQVVGPFPGALSNSGETITLQAPGPPDDTGVVPYIALDAVSYRDRSPWPSAADGDGPSLERISSDAYGNDPLNWQASRIDGGTPGNAEGTFAEDPMRPASSHIAINAVYPNPATDQATIAFSAPSGERVSVAVYDILGREVWTLARNHSFSGTPHELMVDVTPLPSGVYLVLARGETSYASRPLVVVR